MSFPLGKILEIDVDKTQSPDGQDRIVMTRDGDFQFFPSAGLITVHQGDELDLEDQDIFVPFGDNDVELSLKAVNQPGHVVSLGSVFLRRDEANAGELTKKFEGGEALYELKYKVLP
ncbi:hypothetical protein [Streptomyces sp. WELS2]|uniref:hypothetical protein n=1 Tax=Streptomyces sp. WELS2 TaxID=2749435 RepID=UPI0015F0589F|nr:hypothetical protein [Streptomyces sp. WELS2]